jgi:cellulose biosynthesis protein BcsQ
MRIAFLGKGGAGKTTTSAGFIRYVAKKKPYVFGHRRRRQRPLARRLASIRPNW